MTRSDIRESIREYLGHLEDTAYVRSVFTTAGTEAILSVLEEMIREGDREDFKDADLFTRDCFFGKGPRGFRQDYYRSGLLAAFRECLYARDYSCRHNAIATLGRLGPRWNARFLAGALPWYLAHDPLGLDGLLFELAWLTPPVKHRRLRQDTLE